MLRRLGRFLAAYSAILLLAFVACFASAPGQLKVVPFQGLGQALAIVAVLAIAPAVWLSGWKRDLMLTERADDRPDKP